MNETHQDPVGKPETSSGSEGRSKDSVAYESFEKLLNEKKTIQSRYREIEEEKERLRREIEERDREKLEKKGEYEKLLNQYKEENKELRNTVEQRHRAFVMSKVDAAIEAEAARQGCQNVRDFRRLLDQTDIESLSVDDNYSVDPKDVESLVARNKQQRSYLFSKRSANVQSADPVDAPIDRSKPIEKMTDDEIRELYKKLSKQ